MKEIMAIKVQGMKVLTTKQLAEAYESEETVIWQNFKRNRTRYLEGKHYISLSGDNLKAFKNHMTNCQVVNGRASHVYLWTEKGALLHAKSINTDKAWEVYDYLVDYYFRANETMRQQAQPAPPKAPLVVDAPDNLKILNAVQKIKDDLTCMNVLLDTCLKYIPEEAYKERRDMANEMISLIMMDMSALLDAKPKLIEKQY